MDLKSKIEQILAEHDPENLLCYGAPNDEYSSEARILSEQLRPGMSLSEIERVTIDVFHQQFDMVFKTSEDPTANQAERKVVRERSPEPWREPLVKKACKEIFDSFE